jgi:hypothetical protein
MKTRILAIFKYTSIALALVVATMAGPAKAQSLTEGIRVNIPFDFNVGSKSFQPGVYTVKRVSLNNDALLRISSKDGKRGTFFQTIRSRNGATEGDLSSGLVFRRYYANYYLEEILNGVEYRDYTVSQPKERMMAAHSGLRKAPGNKPEVETRVVLAGSL